MMIHCQCNFLSETLKYHTDIEVLLPPWAEIGSREAEVPVLFLLHGGAGDCQSWLRFTNIERYAERYGVAVVMPSGHNSFFCDAAYGAPFFTYITEELIHMVRGLFPVARTREKTFIAGASMGGYGSALVALERPDLVSALGVFSGAIDPHRIDVRLREIGVADMRYDLLFGGSDKVSGSDYDLFKKVAAYADDAPRLFASIYIGKDDEINYDMSLELHEALLNQGFESYFIADEGGHDWGFWDGCVADFLRRLEKGKFI